MANELMPCPVCGGYVDVGWDSDSQGQAVECSTDMNPWHYKVASGDVSKAVEAHNTLARRAEIGRIVEAIVERTQFLTINDCNPTVVLVSTESGTESGSTLLDALRALEREVNDE